MHLRHDEIRQKYGRHFVFKKKKKQSSKIWKQIFILLCFLFNYWFKSGLLSHQLRKWKRVLKKGWNKEKLAVNIRWRTLKPQHHLLEILQNMFYYNPHTLHVNNLFSLFQELQRKIRIPVWTMINWGTAVNIYSKIQWHSCKNEMINCDF